MTLYQNIRNAFNFESSYCALILIFIFNLVFVGPISSYFDLTFFYWIGRGLFLAYFIFFFASKLNNLLSHRLLFLVVFIFFLINLYLFIRTDFSLYKTAFKDYYIPVISLICLLFVKIDERKSNSFYYIILTIALLQFPFILQQFFIESHNSNASRSVDWDLISGTFGFNPGGGGGNSAGLILFLSYFIVLVIDRIRREISTPLDYIALFTSFISILLAETKIFVIFIFIIVLSVFKIREFFNVKRLIFVPVILGGLLLGLVSIYSSNTTQVNGDSLSVAEYAEKIYFDYFETEVIDFTTGEVGRIASVSIWYKEQVNRGWPIESYFGYGLTTSKISNNGIPDSESFGSYINFASTQATTYLWDIGVIGLLIFYGLLLYLLFSNIFTNDSTPINNMYRAGSRFILLSFMIFPFYSLSGHSSTATHCVILLAIMFGMEKQKQVFK